MAEKQSSGRRGSFRVIPPEFSDLTLVLLGNCWSLKAFVGNLLLKRTEFVQIFKSTGASRTLEDNKNLTVVNTPDMLLSSTSQQLNQMVQDIKSLSAPGPHVFLLVLQPEEFTEQHKTRLESVLESFSEQAFQHSLVLICSPREQRSGFMEKYMSEPQIRDVISKCRYRCMWINTDDDENLKEFKRKGLFSRIGQILKEKSEQKPSLNLVLCGRGGPEKSSVVKSMLGSVAPPTASSPGQCVKQQGEVCGRWVSLVDLPPLSGEPMEAVMQQCLSCISLCAPEGIHAFILVLPLGPLTDEDKAELKTIQDTFSYAVNLYTMILFTKDSDHTDPAVEVEEDIQEFCQSIGGGYFIFNTREQQQLSELMKYVESLRSKNKPPSYTTETLIQGQREMISALQKELLKFNSRCDSQSSYNTNKMKIALIGKTGSGKSATANTILGRKEFVTKSSPTSTIQSCQKGKSEIDGPRVTVVDTPGLFDSSMSNKEVINELKKCIALFAPGPHVFLLVIQIGRFTEEESSALEYIKITFGKEAEKYIMILFTRGDDLEEDETTIEEYIEKSDPSLKKLICDCGNRFHVFNNRKKERGQVRELLEKIDDLVKKNGGSHYTNETLKKAEAVIQKERERIMKGEEKIKREMERIMIEIERKYQQQIDSIKQGEDMKPFLLDLRREQAEHMEKMMERLEEQVRRQAEESRALAEEMRKDTEMTMMRTQSKYEHCTVS